MSPNPGPDDIIKDGNYFHWEFNARMALARKDLLLHVTLKADEAAPGVDRETVAWTTADLKAFAILTRSLSPVYQVMVRDATSARNAWGILETFFVRRSLHNRIQLRRQLHEFRMASGSNLLQHLLQFDTLCMSITAVGDQLAEDEKMVILLGSLSSEYDSMVKIIENSVGIDLLGAKEMLRREHEKMHSNAETEMALNAARHNKRGRQQDRHRGRSFRGTPRRDGNDNRGRGRFLGKCFNCNQPGHKKSDCPELSGRSGAGAGEFVFSATAEQAADWLLDSGASSHMTFCESDFASYRQLTTSITIGIANGQAMEARGVGDVRLTLTNGVHVTMKNVLYVPPLDRRLVSVSAMGSKDIEVRFRGDICRLIAADGVQIAEIAQQGKLFVLSTGTASTEKALASVSTMADDEALWYARLGHPPTRRMKEIAQSSAGMPDNMAVCADNRDEEVCSGCMKGKLSVAKFPRTAKTAVKSRHVLAPVHSDVMGPMNVKTVGGSRFVLTFIDDFSRYTMVYFLKKKSEVLDKFMQYNVFAEKQFNHSIRCIRTDNGGEYVNFKFARFCEAHGIIHQTTAPYSPQQHGVSERMNRTLMGMARSMIYHKNVEKRWWGEAVNTAVYTVNRIPNHLDTRKSPFEIVWGRKPDLSGLRVFGAKGFAHIDKAKRKKPDAKAFECVFLGYADAAKAYRGWNVNAGKLVISRSVRLDESDATRYVQVVASDNDSRTIVDSRDDDISSTPIPVATVTPSPEPMDTDEDMLGNPNDLEQMGEENSPPHHHAAGSPLLAAAHDSLHEDSGDPLAVVPVRSEHSWQRTHLNREPFGLVDSDLTVFSSAPQRALPIGRQATEVLTLPPIPDDGHDIETAGGTSQSGDASDRVQVVDDGGRRDSKRQRTESGEQANVSVEVPKTFREAIQSSDADHWKEAMAQELATLTKNHTWDYVEQPTFGVDYEETYAPVINMNSVRVFLNRNLELEHDVELVDADAAFTQGVMKERVGVPVGVVCVLLRSLYGLKQSAAVWYETLSKALKKMGFRPCKSDACVFVKQMDSSPVYIGVYVDDMLIGAKDRTIIADVKRELATYFKIKDIGPVTYVLGVKVLYSASSGTLVLSQKATIERMIERYNQTTAHGTYNPNVPGETLLKRDLKVEEQSDMERRPYRSLVGSLLNVAMATRPDIAFAVGRLSRFVESPNESHWKAAVRVLRYLKSTADVGLHYQVGRRGGGPVAFSDADWASDKQERKSVSGVMVVMNGAPVVYKSKLQRAVALSSAEAEYMALSLCLQEIVWLRSLLKEMGAMVQAPTVVHEDNQSAIAIATNGGYL